MAICQAGALHVIYDMKRFSLLLIICIFSCALLPPQGWGRKVKTTLRIEKKADSASPKKLVKDINGGSDIVLNNSCSPPLILSADSIHFAGYDKTCSSRKESFLVVNNSPVTVTRVEIKITYKDLQGRMLHQRVAASDCFVPPSETRQINISSWDRQNTFYYYLSEEPRKIATPYKVEISLLKAEYIL